MVGAAVLPALNGSAAASQTNAATKIMIIRHAEKPVGTITGINASGVADSSSLIPQGWQRAGALVPLFNASTGPLPVPNYLFAPNLFGSGTSERPFETITPLAAKLGITINAAPSADKPGQYASTDYAAMVSVALGCPGVVLVAWEHEDIPPMANILLGNSTAPQTWPSARFDVVWIFDLNPATNTYAFSQVPQLLLQGRSWPRRFFRLIHRQENLDVAARFAVHHQREVRGARIHQARQLHLNEVQADISWCKCWRA